MLVVADDLGLSLRETLGLRSLLTGLLPEEPGETDEVTDEEEENMGQTQTVMP